MRGRFAAMIGCAVGLAGGFALAVLAGAGERPAGGRYQLHVWQAEGVADSRGGTAFAPSHGAYIIDTMTGDVRTR